MLGLTAESTLIEIPSPEGRPPREAHRSELIEVLEARADQLFGFVRAEIQRAGMDRSLLEGVVLTGGGACCPACGIWPRRSSTARRVWASRKAIEDWPEELRSPVWATAAGLAMYSAKLKLHRPPQGRNRGLMGLVMR